MDPSLLEDLAFKPVREISGSDSSARFDYQKDWALSRMFDFHIADKDYLVAFEFHDDVVFLNSENNPSAVDFFQVKTQKRTTTRKLQSFLQRKKDANSIVGKLCQNLDGICKDHTIRLIIVSNISYEFSNADICAADLKTADKNKILQALQAELPELDQSILDKLHFYISCVPLEGFPIHLQGQASEIFRQRFGENAGYNIFSWIRLIQGEIKRKNSFPPDEIYTIEDLKHKKCLGRSFLNSTLKSVQEQHRNVLDMNLIKDDLKQNGWGLSDILRLDKAMPNAVADFQDPSNVECLGIRSKIAFLLSELSLEDCKLSAVLIDIYNRLKDEASIPQIYREKPYLCCLTLMVYYEKL